MDILLDESVPNQVENALEKEDIDTMRCNEGEEDYNVMTFAIENQIPVLTRDQGDFPRLGQELEHPGILLDKQMHLRKDTEMVAQTIKKLIKQIPEKDLKNSTWYVSNYYGR